MFDFNCPISSSLFSTFIAPSDELSGSINQTVTLYLFSLKAQSSKLSFLPIRSDFVLSQKLHFYAMKKKYEATASEYSYFFLVQGKRPPQNCQQTHSWRVLEQNGSPLSEQWLRAESWKCVEQQEKVVVSNFSE